ASTVPASGLTSLPNMLAIIAGVTDRFHPKQGLSRDSSANRGQPEPATAADHNTCKPTAQRKATRQRQPKRPQPPSVRPSPRSEATRQCEPSVDPPVPVGASFTTRNATRQGEPSSAYFLVGDVRLDSPKVTRLRQRSTRRTASVGAR